MVTGQRKWPRAVSSSLAILASAALPFNQAVAQDGMSLDDLAQGVPVGTECFDSEVSLPSGVLLDPGCYDLIAHIMQEDVGEDGTPIFGAIVEFVSSTGEVVANVESTGFVIQDDPENRSDIDVVLDSRTRVADLFDFTQEPDPLMGGSPRIVADAKTVMSCTSTCMKRACGVCGADHKTQWDEPAQICHTSTQAGGNCVVDEYNDCFDERCNLAKRLLELSLSGTGLVGAGGVAGRIVRFAFGL